MPYRHPSWEILAKICLDPVLGLGTVPACEARNRPGLSPEPNNNKFVNMNTYMNRANVIASYGNSTCLEKSFFWPTDGSGPTGPLRFPHGRADLRYWHLCGVIALMILYYNQPKYFWASSIWRQQTVRASWGSRRSPHCFISLINITRVILNCSTKDQTYYHSKYI